MGHVRVYTICDVLTRYYKQRGKQVINPMGWDSFGLPAENAAIERNISPKRWTDQNIKDTKEELQSMGFDFDWDLELSTCQPDYYQHTQQIFGEMFDRGLAYKKDAQVNWDPVDQTVLANEQIDANGRSWRSGALAERKSLSQWFLNIRSYADEMLDGLDNLDKWPDAVKESQRGWIGKSEGANIRFKVVDSDDTSIEVFTTRPETIFGVTYIAISHESESLLNELCKSSMAARN